LHFNTELTNSPVFPIKEEVGREVAFFS